MDERPEPQRIEIELTAHEPAPGHRPARQPDDAEPTEAAVPAPAASDDQRRRLVVGASVIAVVSLLVGVLVGRMGARETEPAADVDSTVATTTERSESEDTLSDPEANVVPPPSRPFESATTTGVTSPVEPVEGRIEVLPSASAAGEEIIALTNRGELVRIDLATGSTVTTEADVGFGPVSLHAGAGWVLASRLDAEQSSTVVYDDGTQSSIDTGGPWPLFPTGESGRFWLGDGDPGDGAPRRLVEISVDGERTGAEVELDGFFPAMVDPLGGVVIEAPGGSYAVTPDGRTRLSTGRVVVLGRERVLVHECSEQLECAYEVVDRATGERRAIPLDDAFAGDAVLDAGGWWTPDEPMNAAEDAAIVITWDQFGSGPPSLGVLDLLDGSYTRIGGLTDVPSMRWAADGRHVFWVGSGLLRVFDRDTGESVLLSEDLGGITAFTTRPDLADPPVPPPSTDGG